MAQCEGYESDAIVSVVYAKTLANRTLPLTPTNAFSLLSLLPGAASPLRIVDFGGGCGAEYFNARRLLPSSRSLAWTVVETPAMAAKAANAELRFASSLDALQADVVHSSGTLQCVDDPLGYLRRLMDIGAEHLVFNRLGFSLGPQVISVHESWLSWNGPGPMPPGMPDRKVRYPFVFPCRDDFISLLQERYDLVASFDDDTGIFEVDRARLVGGGLIARRRS